MDISGRVAIVTGGARGIGRCYVEFLLKKGAKVCIGDVLDEDGAAAVKEFSQTFKGKVIFVNCDVTRLEDIKGILSRAEKHLNGKVSILVNNAGVLCRDPHDSQHILNVNLKGVMDGTYEAFDYMSRDNGGQGGTIVNITSIAGLKTAAASPPYLATKHGVTAFTQCFALEISEKFPSSGVRVCGLAPTFVRTVMTSKFDIKDYDPEGTLYKMFHYGGGFEEAEDVAAGLVSLLEREDSHNVILLVKGKVMKRIKTTIEELDW